MSLIDRFNRVVNNNQVLSSSSVASSGALGSRISSSDLDVNFQSDSTKKVRKLELNTQSLDLILKKTSVSPIISSLFKKPVELNSQQIKVDGSELNNNTEEKIVKKKQNEKENNEQEKQIKTKNKLNEKSKENSKVKNIVASIAENNSTKSEELIEINPNDLIIEGQKITNCITMASGELVNAAKNIIYNAQKFADSLVNDTRDEIIKNVSDLVISQLYAMQLRNIKSDEVTNKIQSTLSSAVELASITVSAKKATVNAPREVQKEVERGIVYHSLVASASYQNQQESTSVYHSVNSNRQQISALTKQFSTIFDSTCGSDENTGEDSDNSGNVIDFSSFRK